MKRRTRLVRRSLAGATIATLTALGLSPAATTPPRATSPSANPRQTFSSHWHGSGTLVALHAKQETGDLAEADGTLIPLRFLSRAQMQHVTLGDELTVSADAHSHSRLIVRSLSRKSLRAIGARGSRKSLRVRGLVARLLGHGQVEVLGVNGAAVIVDARAAHIVIAGSPYTTAGTGGALFAPSIAVAASLDQPRSFAPNEAIDTQVIWSRAKTMVVTTASVVATHVALIDVEGTVTRVNRAGRTVTLVDENGLSTVVHVGAGVMTYRVGQNAEASGAPMGTGQLQVRAVERESIPATSVAPPRKTKDAPVSHTPATGTPAVAHAATPVAPSTPTSRPGAATATGPSATPAPVVPIPGAPTSAATSVPATTAAATTVPAAMAAATFTAIPTATPTALPPATSTATNTPGATSTATNTPGATATSTATATATAMNTSIPIPTATGVPVAPGAPANTATTTATGTVMVMAEATATATPSATATATATPSATATATATPSVMTPSATPTFVTSPASCAATTPIPVDTSSDPPPAPIKGAPQGLKAQYQVGDPGKPCDAYIAPKLRIVNGGGNDMSLKDLTARYWFTADTKQPQNWFSGPVGPGTAAVHPLATPVHGADAYVEISFSDKAGAIASGASLDLPFQLCKPGASNNSCPFNPEPFDEYDDYSYNPFMTSFADWDRVTLYYQGKLIWGAEPR